MLEAAKLLFYLEKLLVHHLELVHMRRVARQDLVKLISESQRAHLLRRPHRSLQLTILSCLVESKRRYHLLLEVDLLFEIVVVILIAEEETVRVGKGLIYGLRFIQFRRIIDLVVVYTTMCLLDLLVAIQGALGQVFLNFEFNLINIGPPRRLI